jgi:hypothetical protein
MKKYLIILIVLISVNLFAQDKGVINGTLSDKETQKPVADAIVEVIELGRKCASSTEGKFVFENVPYGTYQVKVTSLGYESITKTDVVVLSARPTQMVIDMMPLSYQTDVIDVEARYFQKVSGESTSSFNLDFEEVRRAPGAVEDILRMVQILPGVAPGNDQRNDLIVRGGSPAENLTIIDGIEIPNVNHYPTTGSSSGPIGMINVKFISNVDFSTGGFSARYGDKLSSALNLTFREGYRKRFLSDINLSTAGFGGLFEGPLFTQKGSFMFSVRKSYLNLIKSAIRLAAVPDYWDFNFKSVYDINKDTKLSFVSIAGLDKISFTGDDSKISDDNPYGKAQGHQEQFTAGFNLKNLFKKGYLQTVLANSSSFTFYDNLDIRTDKLKFRFDSYESDFNFKSELFYQLSKQSNIMIGAGARYIKFKNELFYNQDTTAFGYVIPEINQNAKTNYQKASAYAVYTLRLFKDKLHLNPGVRYDYFSGIENKSVVSPRFSASFELTPITTLNASTGIYYQSPDYLWITADDYNKNLKYIRAYHYVAGIEHLFSSDLRVSVEGYYKKYENYPVSLDVPTYVLISGGADNGPNILFGKAVSEGYGYSRGIDVSIQKKLTGSGFYGMVSYSFAESKVTALVGGEKPGSFDYRHNLTVIAGYQLTNEWLIGMKLRYTTGRPYTPFDEAASTAIGRGISDFNNFNGSRFKDYNRLDLRVDKKWNLKGISIITYFELQNVFNVTNEYQYFWNEYKNKQGTIYQWAFLPVGGFSIQF